MGDWAGKQYMIWLWSLFGISTFFVIARLYVQFRFRYRPWRETFVVTAWVLNLGTCICNSIMNDVGYFEDSYWARPERLGPIANYVQVYTWMISMFACKFTLLLFFGDLVPRHLFHKTWWFMLGVWVFCGIGLAYHVLSLLLDCFPFDLNWAAANASCNFSAPVVLTSLSFHFVTDLLVYAVPFLLLHNLITLSWHAKAGALVMSALGLFNVIAAGLQVAFYAEIFNDGGRVITLASSQWLFVAQPSTCIMIICAPHCRRLWRGTSDDAMKREKEERERHEALGRAGDLESVKTEEPVVVLRGDSVSSASGEHEGGSGAVSEKKLEAIIGSRSL